MNYINFFLIFSTFVAMAFAATVPNTICPNNFSGIIPEPNDCSGYYVCTLGTPVLRHCLPGTAWNPQKRTCDWVYNVADCNGKESSWLNNQNKVAAQPTWNNQQNQAPNQVSWNKAATQSPWNNKQNQVPNQVSWNQAPTQPSWNNNKNQIPAQPAWNNQQNQAPTQPSWNNKQNQVPIQPSWNSNQNQLLNHQLWNKIPAFPSGEDC